MNWFSQNKFLTGFLVVLVLAIGGAGYYLSTAYGKYRDAIQTFDQEKNTLASLEGRPLYPNAENVGKIKEQSSSYEEKVRVLQEALLKFQKPLDTGIVNTEFPNFVKARTTQFLAVAKAKGVTLPEEFYIGFPDYRDVFPRPPAVPLLHYQAQAIEALLMKLVGTGVEQIISINRAKLPVENADYEAPDPAPVLETYPLELIISGNHESIRNFFNAITNDEEYFFKIRVVRIENSAKEGPVRGGSGELEEEIGMVQDDFDLFPSDTPDEPAEDPVKYDAKIVMGQEEVRVYMLIDVLRFVEIE